ncbi:MAG TPA: hypothetical protein VIN39_06195 [Candidatus Dormibacteraeota bacterium]|jgi:hypothetical protein
MRTAVLSRAAALYIGVTGLTALAVAALFWRSDVPAAALPTFVLVTVLGMVAHAFPIRAARHQAYQVTLPFIIIAAALFTMPQLVAFIVLIHLAEQARTRRPLYIVAFNLSDYFLSAAVATAFYHRAIILMPAGALGQVEAALAAGCAFIMLNRVLLMGVLWLARGLSPSRCGLFKPELLAADLVIIWIAAPMLVLTTQAGPWMAVVTAGPLCLMRPALVSLLAERDRPTTMANAA